MIKNERQYRITKAQADKFTSALEAASTAQPPPTLLEKLEIDAVRSQLHDLKTELREYESLRSGQEDVLSLHSFSELPAALVKARIAAGLSQKELADRLGVKEQQVQRYEATDYSTASIRRLGRVIDALGARVHADVFLSATTSDEHI